MAPPPSPSKLGAERISVNVSVSTLALELPVPAARRTSAAASRPSRTPAAHARPATLTPGQAHADCQTDPSLLEPLQSPEAEAAVQTDTSLQPLPPLPAALPPPLPAALPPPRPPPAGVDASSQVTEDELLDFDRDVAPVVHAMVATALQRALVEAEARERLEALHRRRRELEEVRLVPRVPVVVGADDLFGRPCGARHILASCTAPPQPCHAASAPAMPSPLPHNHRSTRLPLSPPCRRRSASSRRCCCWRRQHSAEQKCGRSDSRRQSSWKEQQQQLRRLPLLPLA